MLGTVPSPDTTEELSRRQPLRVAELWHLALALTLQEDLPELTLLTYDARLHEAARREGCA